MNPNNKTGFVSAQFTSNSLSGSYMKDIMRRTVRDILRKITPSLGPGATDSFIMKDHGSYYTRDGKEVMESLMFNNELANQIHHILYQAVYNQGVNIGDGSTTLAVLYCTMMYILLNNDGSQEVDNFQSININQTRKMWRNYINTIIEKIRRYVVPVDDELLKSMLYTCTQDEDLTAKIYLTLKDAILAGAYIVPRKSNIATDFNVTVYNRPLIKVTKQFSLKPIPDSGTVKNAVVLYCNGVLDIANPETIISLASKLVYTANDNNWLEETFIILCHGLTQTTRNTIRSVSELVNRSLKANNSTIESVQINNVAIYTMDNYRSWDNEELEDLSTIITDEIGIGSLVRPITFETYLYLAYSDAAIKSGEIDPVKTIEGFDADPSIIEKFRHLQSTPFDVIFDSTEGMALEKVLGPNANARYNKLKTEIEEEKSGVRKVALNRRLRRTFGMFIDVEIGSTLLKDSQRKYELILDALISSSGAIREGVIPANSIFLTYGIALENTMCQSAEMQNLFISAIASTFEALVSNYTGDKSCSNFCYKLVNDVLEGNATYSDFNIEKLGPDGENIPSTVIGHAMIDGNEVSVEIKNQVVEPFSSIKAILENSILPIELVKTKVFNMSSPVQGNYVP